MSNVCKMIVILISIFCMILGVQVDGLKNRITLLEGSITEIVKKVYPNIETEYNKNGHKVEGLTIIEYTATRTEAENENNNAN